MGAGVTEKIMDNDFLVGIVKKLHRQLLFHQRSHLITVWISDTFILILRQTYIAYELSLTCKKEHALIMSWVSVSRSLQYFRMSFHLLIINHEILERVIQKFFGIPIFGIWKTYLVFIPVYGCLKWHFVIQNVINLILWCLLNNKNQVLNNIPEDLTNYMWSLDMFTFSKSSGY